MRAVPQALRWLLIPLALTATGCGIEFPDEEMDLAGSGNTRPIAVTFTPAEIEPGGTVTATLHLFEPEPATYDADWRIALDYDIGLYETDEVERDYVAPTSVSPPEFDEQGFGTQTVTFTVPRDILLTTSRQPDVIVDELILGALEGILPSQGSGTVTRDELDGRLGDQNWATQEEYLRLCYVADLFSCEVRFRIELRGTTTIDVTRNLTVRWSSAYLTNNVNTNPAVTGFDLVTVRRPDVAWDDVDLEASDTSVQPIPHAPGDFPMPVMIETHADWTYYVRSRLALDTYTSPFDPQTPLEEDYWHNWYQIDLVHPDSGHPLFIADDGDAAEMGDLNNVVRLDPPLDIVARTFRLYDVSRDLRWEWDKYSSAPGTGVAIGEVSFVAPESR